MKNRNHFLQTSASGTIAVSLAQAQADKPIIGMKVSPTRIKDVRK